jgi:hypothetical protein
MRNTTPILAIDLGKYKRIGCVNGPARAGHLGSEVASSQG